MVKDRNEAQAAALLKIANMIKALKIPASALDQVRKTALRRGPRQTVGQVTSGMRRKVNEVEDLLRPFERESADDLVLEILALL
jgi:hypothetical protein